MPKVEELYEFRDPVYGFILLNKAERELVDTEPFQRLRRIRQLGTTYLVYPGAEHTRFEHSLGVVHIATHIYDMLTPKLLSTMKWSQRKASRYRKILRMSALLHDIGHPPFSHAAASLFPEGEDHESYTMRVIKETEVWGNLQNYFGDPVEADSVLRVATGTGLQRDEIILNDLISGDLGADRIDYLLRDSLHIGVHYGRFDYQRLIHTMTIRTTRVEEESYPELALDEDGLHAAEGLILARYFMFLQVYFHKTRRILDRHLTSFMRRHTNLENGCFPKKIEKYLDLDDDKVLYIIAQKRDTLAAKRLLGRQHYRVCDETSDHPDRDELIMFQWLWEEASRKFGRKNILLDEAVNDPYNYQEPRIHVYMRTGEMVGKFALIDDPRVSPLISGLRPIRKQRVYADLRITEEVKKFCTQFRRDRRI